MTIPDFNEHGYLPPGQYQLTNWQELENRFGQTETRRELLAGLKKALLNLQQAGCQKVYLDGSFVTDETDPNDYDGVWDDEGITIDAEKLARIDELFLPNYNEDDLQDDREQRAKKQEERCKQQKQKYGGELFISSEIAIDGRTMLEYYQEDRKGIKKGIIYINLQLFNCSHDNQ